MAIDPKKPNAFLSYTRADDDYFNGGISWLREKLEQAVQARTGAPFQIFQDVEDIQPGNRWATKLDQALEAAQLFIPILTPSFFTSAFCRREAKAFLDYEARAGRDDLILPLYLINTPVLENLALRHDDDVAEALRERQHDDWRLLRIALQHQDTRPKAAEKIDELAETIAAAAIEKSAERKMVEDTAAEVVRRIESDEVDDREISRSVDQHVASDTAEIARELEATKMELAELKRQQEEERRYWQEKEAESEQAVEVALTDASREQADEALKRRKLQVEKRQLVEKLKAMEEAQAKQLQAAEQENERLRLAEAKAAKSDPPRNSVYPNAMAASVLLLLLASGTGGALYHSATNEKKELAAKLEATEMRLAAARNLMKGLSQKVTQLEADELRRAALTVSTDKPPALPGDTRCST